MATNPPTYDEHKGKLVVGTLAILAVLLHMMTCVIAIWWFLTH